MSDSLFSDLLVIDCASFVAGPAAATMLADLGARVIKIEPTGGGDGYRMLKHLPGLPLSEKNYPWTLTNRNKESLALDLKSEEGRGLLDKLIAKADVFITNYPLPVRKRLGLNYEDISAVNPKAIYASLTPYGEQGPEADKTGYDATAWWARSGLMDLVRYSPETPPGISVPGMGDHMTANTLYGAIVTGLYRRERTGEGTMVGTSLMANGLWSNGITVQAALDGADMSQHLSKDVRSAFTEVYCCSDNRWFILTILGQAEERAWPELVRCLERDELIEDALFSTAEARKQNNAALKEILRECFLLREWADWNTRFAEHGITCGRIAQAIDYRNDEQAEAAQMLTEFDDGSGDRTIDSPLFVAGAVKKAPRRAPDAGEHSLAILEELGFDAASQQRLLEAGIVS